MKKWMIAAMLTAGCATGGPVITLPAIPAAIQYGKLHATLTAACKANKLAPETCAELREAAKGVEAALTQAAMGGAGKVDSGQLLDLFSRVTEAYVNAQTGGLGGVILK